MSEDSDRSGFDPSLPWRIWVQRSGEWMIAETFGKAVQCIRYVAEVPNPADIIVEYLPGDQSGKGDDFLREVNRRMAENG